MKILVASKVGFIRHNLQRCLKEDGHSVVTCDSRHGTLNLIGNDCQIGIVIADWAESGVSPTDVIKDIRRIDRMNDSGEVAAPYVFVLTRSSEAPEFENGGTPSRGARGLALAFGEVFIKPVDMQLLRKRVQANVIAAKVTPPSPAKAPEVQSVPNPVPAEAALGKAAPSPSPSHTPGLSGIVEIPSLASSLCFD